MKVILGILLCLCEVSLVPGVIQAEAATDEALGRCLKEASEHYGIHPYLLVAIVEVESGWHPWAISYREGGVWKARYPHTYEDAVRNVEEFWERGLQFGTGLGQISAVHLRELDVEDPTILLDPCANLYWASYILKVKMQKYGNTWLAIERYNGINPAYPAKVQAVLRTYEVEE